jgi:hypothetical protein
MPTTTTPTDTTLMRDLETMLRTLRVTKADGEWCVVNLASPPADTYVRASVVEAEGTSYVIATDDAAGLGIRPDFIGAWLTLEVNSALDAVGLTAAVASALAKANIACNVFAGLHHDHLLVPTTDSARAIATLEALKTSSQRLAATDDPATRLTTLT